MLRRVECSGLGGPFHLQDLECGHAECEYSSEYKK